MGYVYVIYFLSVAFALLIMLSMIIEKAFADNDYNEVQKKENAKVNTTLGFASLYVFVSVLVILTII